MKLVTELWQVCSIWEFFNSLGMVSMKKRTLTNLYNQRPSWLDNAHKTLDKVVAEAYCWTYCWTDYSGPQFSDNHLRW